MAEREPPLTNLRPQSLEARIDKSKQQITALGDLRPGNLTQQYNVCGKPDCRCGEGTATNYRRLRQLLDRWMVLAMELSRLRLQQPCNRGRLSAKTRRKPRVSSQT